MRYNEAAGATTWQTSDLRTWLNGEFFDTAFDEDERAAIVEVKLDNPDNADFGVPGGDAAADKVFCLSLDELGLYFGVRSTKQLGREYPHLIALPTSYAMARWAYANSRTKGARRGGAFCPRRHAAHLHPPQITHCGTLGPDSSGFSQVAASEPDSSGPQCVI